MNEMSQYQILGKPTDIPVGESRVYRVGGLEIAVFNVHGSFFATENLCPHRGGPLGEGMLHGKVVSCPWHAWTFDVTTGICTFHSEARVKTYPVRVENGELGLVVD